MSTSLTHRTGEDRTARDVPDRARPLPAWPAELASANEKKNFMIRRAIRADEVVEAARVYLNLPNRGAGGSQDSLSGR